MMRFCTALLGATLSLACMPALAQVQPSAPVASKGYVDAQTATRQPSSALLSGLAAVSPTADQVIYATGSNAFAATSLPVFARTLIGSASAAAARTTLGLGGAAVLNVGTAAGTVADGGALASEVSRAQAAEALLAPLASPTFTGTPRAPTAASGTNTTQVSSTAFTTAAVAAETTRATGVEQSNATAIGNEVTRATAAEALLAPLANPSFTGAVNVGGTLAVGGGEAIKAVRRLTVTVGIGTIPANSTVQFNNIPLPGVKTGDLLTVSLGNAWSSIAIPMYAISYADNMISLFAANPTSSAQSVSTQPIVVRAERY